MDEKIIDLLIYSFDNPLSKEEQNQLNHALKGSSELRAEQERLLKMREKLKRSNVPKDTDFVDRVMQRLEQEKIIPSGNLNVVFLKWFPKIAAACILLLLTSFLSIYLDEGQLSSDALIGLSDVTPEEASTYFEE